MAEAAKAIITVTALLVLFFHGWFMFETLFDEADCLEMKCAAGKLVTLYGGQCACITEPK